MKTKSRTTMGLRVAAVAFGTAMACVAPMWAQDTPPAAPAGQQQGRGGGRGNSAEMEQSRLDMMTKQLSLTPDQVVQVKTILDTQRQQMQAMRDSVGAGGDPRQQMSDIRRSTSAKIRGVLTDDQKPKFDEMEARMAQRQGAGGPGGPPPTPPPGV